MYSIFIYITFTDTQNDKLEKLEKRIRNYNYKSTENIFITFL